MPFQLQVRTPRTLTVNDLHADDDVNVLLAAVERKSHTPLTLSWLAFEGRKLEPGRSLAQYGLRNGATVHLATRGRGGGCGGSKQVQNESISTSPAGIPPPRQTQQPLAAGSTIAAVDVALANLEAALEADEHTDAIAARAEQYALAIVAAPGELPPPGTYTDAASIFAAMRPGDDATIPPVRLLRSTWIKNRAAQLRAATSDEERRALRLPRRQDIERDEPSAFLSVEELEALPHCNKTGKLAAASSSYCWYVCATEPISRREHVSNSLHGRHMCAPVTRCLAG